MAVSSGGGLSSSTAKLLPPEAHRPRKTCFMRFIQCSWDVMGLAILGFHMLCYQTVRIQAGVEDAPCGAQSGVFPACVTGKWPHVKPGVGSTSKPTM